MRRRASRIPHEGGNDMQSKIITIGQKSQTPNPFTVGKGSENKRDLWARLVSAQMPKAIA